ncbi:MAG: ABC transporter substrate-binding protein [Eubacteriales bacterium]|nr:ABC transporter substrate-binding protein [Eubacteriales bacterium]
MKRLAVLFAVLAVAVAAVILMLPRGPEGGDKGAERPIILGFSQLGSESGWRIGNTRSVITAAQRAGVQLMFKNAEQKQENQIDAIRSFIAYQVDVIAFAPIVEDGWDNVLREAKDAGIPVICSDRSVILEDDSLITGFVGSDFYLEGVRAGEYLLKKMADAPGPVRIAEISGTIDSTPMRYRALGFRDIIKDDPLFEIVYSQSGDFLRSRGKEVMEDILITAGPVDVLYSHNDSMTLGAIETIEQKGLNPGKDMVIISVDGEQGAIDLLKQGKINCVVECTPMLCDMIMDLAQRLARGETIDRITYSEETVFSDFDPDVLSIPPRWY